MFWGLVLEPWKKYTQKVDKTFHISQAALDLKSCNQEPIQLVVEYENSNFVLATLSMKANIFQVPLDLIFKTGDQVSFRTVGNGKVHLSGYHVLEDIDTLMNDEDESDFEMEELETQRKRKKPTPNKENKKLKLGYANEQESDSDEENDSEEDDEEHDTTSVKNKSKKKKAKADSTNVASADDDDDDEEDNEEEEDDDIFDEEGEEEEDDEDDDDSEMEEDDEDDEMLDIESDEDEEESLKTPKSASKKSPQTPNGIASSKKGKEKTPQKLNTSKKEGKQQSTPGKEGKTPNTEKKKNEKNLKNSDNLNTPQGKNSKTNEKTLKSKTEGSPQKRVLEGGLISEEIKIGDGPVAKPGKMVNVYYVGTLATTKKQFDSIQSGPGFKFRIGKNEVIKGWDIGLNGMKVGGKRRLTIPPHLAYGVKGAPPAIPPNSTLIFTVELKGIS